MKLGTRLVHKAGPTEEATGAVVPSIQMASTFQQDGIGRHKGFEYARTGNPTRSLFEAALADAESGTHGFAFSSGMGAITTLTSMLSKGDHVVAGQGLYGGTRRVFDQVFGRLGVEFTYVDGTDAGAFGEAIQDNTRLVYTETPTNPTITLTDLKAVAKAGAKHNLPLAVDNTFLSPYGQRPLELGASVSIHSVTKYIGGHSDLLAGALVTNDAELAERLGFLQNALGAVASPFDAWLAMRGLKTLHLRMRAHSDNALAVAQYLERHGKVARVNFPGLASHPQHGLAKKQQHVWGGMLSFEVKGGAAEAGRVLRALRVFKLAESLGGVESLASNPAKMTHAGLTPKQREALGITPGLVRLSVGVEEAEDLVADLRHALRSA